MGTVLQARVWCIMNLVGGQILDNLAAHGLLLSLSSFAILTGSPLAGLFFQAFGGSFFAVTIFACLTIYVGLAVLCVCRLMVCPKLLSVI